MGYLTTQGKHTQGRRQGELCPTPRICTTLAQQPTHYYYDGFMSVRYGTVSMSAHTQRPIRPKLWSYLVNRSCQKRGQEPALGLAESFLLRSWLLSKDRSRAGRHFSQQSCQLFPRMSSKRPLLLLLLVHLSRFPRRWAGGQLKVGANLGT